MDAELVTKNMEEDRPTQLPQALLLKDAPLLLQHDYLPLEVGFAACSDGLQHIATTTYMRDCTGDMIDWWFSWLSNSEQYKLWHPRDHVSFRWDDVEERPCNYIGKQCTVEEYVGGNLGKFRLLFVDPKEYFGPSWKTEFAEAGYSTAICARGSACHDDGSVTLMALTIHLVKEEPDGCRMRSRFWIGDIDGRVGGASTEPKHAVPAAISAALLKHATEEMAILATRLPSLHRDFSGQW